MLLSDHLLTYNLFVSPGFGQSFLERSAALSNNPSVTTATTALKQLETTATKKELETRPARNSLTRRGRKSGDKIQVP